MAETLSVARSIQARFRDRLKGRIDRSLFWLGEWWPSLILLVLGLLGLWFGRHAGSLSEMAGFAIGLTLLLGTSIQWAYHFARLPHLADLTLRDFDAVHELKLGAGPFGDWIVESNMRGSALHNPALDAALDAGNNPIELDRKKFVVDRELRNFALLVFSKLGPRTTNDKKVRLCSDLSEALITGVVKIKLQKTDYFSEAVWKFTIRDSRGRPIVIQAWDVDRAKPWPDGQDRQEDQALPLRPDGRGVG